MYSYYILKARKLGSSFVDYSGTESYLPSRSACRLAMSDSLDCILVCFSQKSEVGRQQADDAAVRNTSAKIDMKTGGSSG